MNVQDQIHKSLNDGTPTTAKEVADTLSISHRTASEHLLKLTLAGVVIRFRLRGNKGYGYQSKQLGLF